jgi:hypothetical protein
MDAHSLEDSCRHERSKDLKDLTESTGALKVLS